MTRVGQNQIDCCPHCGDPFQIICVKFGLRGAATEFGLSELRACARGTRNRQTIGQDHPISRARTCEDGMLNLRTRRVVAFIIGAVIVAAILRHGFHVYGGYSRPEIAVGALIALPAVMLIFLLLRNATGEAEVGRVRRNKRMRPNVELGMSSNKLKIQIRTA